MLASARCQQCSGRTRAGGRCSRSASCRKNCPNRCWQHSPGYQVGVGCPAAAAVVVPPPPAVARRRPRRIVVVDDDNEDADQKDLPVLLRVPGRPPKGQRNGKSEASSDESDSEDEQKRRPRPKVRVRPPKGQRSGKSEASSDDQSSGDESERKRRTAVKTTAAKRLPLSSPIKPISPLGEKLLRAGLHSNNVCEFFLKHPYSNAEKKEKWVAVLAEAAEYIRTVYDEADPLSFVHFTGGDMTHLFDMLDTHFFGGLLRIFITVYRKLTMRFSNRWKWRQNELRRKLSRASRKNMPVDLEMPNGETLIDKYGYVVLRMFRPNFSKLFTLSQRSYPHSGLGCHSRLECYLQTLAHETIHAILMVFCREKNNEERTGHGPTFFALFRNIYGGQSRQSYTSEMLAGADVYDAERVVAQWLANKEQTFQVQRPVRGQLGVVPGKILSIDEFLVAKVHYEHENVVREANVPLFLIRPNGP